MIDFFIALCVAAYFGATWAAGRYLPKVIAACFPVAAFAAVVVLALVAGLSGVRDWLMVGVVICITLIVTLSGRAARRKSERGADQSVS